MLGKTGDNTIENNDREGISSIYKCQENGDRLFSVLPQHEAEILCAEGGRALEQLPGEIVDSPSLETLKTHLATFLRHLL